MKNIPKPSSLMPCLTSSQPSIFLCSRFPWPGQWSGIKWSSIWPTHSFTQAINVNVLLILGVPKLACKGPISYQWSHFPVHQWQDVYQHFGITPGCCSHSPLLSLPSLFVVSFLFCITTMTQPPPLHVFHPSLNYAHSTFNHTNTLTLQPSYILPLHCDPPQCNHKNAAPTTFIYNAHFELTVPDRKSKTSVDFSFCFLHDDKPYCHWFFLLFSWPRWWQIQLPPTVNTNLDLVIINDRLIAELLYCNLFIFFFTGDDNASAAPWFRTHNIFYSLPLSFSLTTWQQG